MVQDTFIVRLLLNMDRKSYMRFQLTCFTLTLGNIERSNKGYMFLMGCILKPYKANVQLLINTDKMFQLPHLPLSNDMGDQGKSCQGHPYLMGCIMKMVQATDNIKQCQTVLVLLTWLERFLPFTLGYRATCFDVL